MDTYDVRVADVWRSKAGRDAAVERRAPVYDLGQRATLDKVLVSLKTGVVKDMETRNFVKGRTLVERGGVRVGDVVRDGLDHYAVQSISGDHASCESNSVERATVRMPLADLAAMRLVERDGKAV